MNTGWINVPQLLAGEEAVSTENVCTVYGHQMGDVKGESDASSQGISFVELYDDMTYQTI